MVVSYVPCHPCHRHMQGVEYVLLHTQEPILYIVRKQNRYAPTQVTPLANYHIIGGQVFQTPDLGSVINSRMVGAASAVVTDSLWFTHDGLHMHCGIIGRISVLSHEEAGSQKVMGV